MVLTFFTTLAKGVGRRDKHDSSISRALIQQGNNNIIIRLKNKEIEKATDLS